MKDMIYRVYELKFYLNAQHYITIDGKRGQLHPHTWEFTLRFQLPRDSFVEFSQVEKTIQEYLAPYQNQVMNDMEPFDTLEPTVENMTDYFAQEFQRLIGNMQGNLLEVRNSETPTRSYIVELEGNASESGKKSDVVSRALDHALDEIIHE